MLLKKGYCGKILGISIVRIPTLLDEGEAYFVWRGEENVEHVVKFEIEDIAQTILRGRP